MKTKLTYEDISNIIELYQTEISSTHKLAKKFKVGHKKISQILKENNIDINKKGGQPQIGNSSEIESTKSNIYISSDTYELVAQCKKTNVVIKDPNNLSGKLTKHIIDLYGEVIGEDERFAIITKNLGYDIHKDEEYIFNDSDIE